MRWSWIEVDGRALTENARRLATLARPKALMAVVKANAYGHGDVWAAWHAMAGGARWLGVATLDEALRLRRAGLRCDVLVLGAIAPEDVPAAIRGEVSVALPARPWLGLWSGPARATGRPLRVHLKVDTGMGRLGVPPREAPAMVEEIRRQAQAFVLEGIFSHLAASEDDGPYTELQVARFRQALAAVGDPPTWIHIQNSGGILGAQVAEATMVRSGILLYGLAPGGRPPVPAGFRPVLSLRARAVQTKVVDAGQAVGYGLTWIADERTTIATLPIGYADGWPRSLSNAGRVLFRGAFYPIVGRVSMDSITVALPPDVACEVGDVFTLIGEDGEGVITADDVAARAGTIGYEIVSRLSLRLPRVDAGTGAVVE